MREGTFNIHAKGYPERWHGTEIRYEQGETIDEILAKGHADSVDAIVKAFYGQFNIRASAIVKDLAGKEGTTATQLAEALSTFQIKAERQTRSTGPLSPEEKQARKAKAQENKAKLEKIAALEAKAQEDPEVAKALKKLQALGLM